MEDKKKSIAFIIGTMQGGGAERVISILSSYFVKANYDVTIIMLRKANFEYQFSERIKTVILTSESTWLRRNLYTPFLLAKEMKRQNSDIYISFCTLENIMTCLANIFAQRRIILSERSAPTKELQKPYVVFARKWLYRIADAFVFQTKGAMSFYNKTIQKKSIVISNPIKIEYPTLSTDNIRNSIVAVGRLITAKNYPLLIGAFRRFHEIHSEYVLEIYGKGPEEIPLLKLVCDYGIQDYVYFRGFHEGVHEEIKNAKMYVLSSDYEGLPNALLEAMAIGLPVIATNCPAGGPADLIQDGENGFLINVGDENGLVKAMLTLSENETLRKNLAGKATYVRDTNSADSIFSKWEMLVGDVVNKKLQIKKRML